MAPPTDIAFEALKDRVITVERQQAVKSEADKSIEERLTKIEVVLSRLTWLLVTGIGGAFVAFVINGGLKGVVG